MVERAFKREGKLNDFIYNDSEKNTVLLNRFVVF